MPLRNRWGDGVLKTYSSSLRHWQRNLIGALLNAKTCGLDSAVLEQKYVAPNSIIEWIRNPNKSSLNSSIMWKALIKAFDLVGGGIAWKVGIDRSIRVGVDPWAGCGWNHILPNHLIEAL